MQLHFVQDCSKITYQVKPGGGQHSILWLIQKTISNIRKLSKIYTITDQFIVRSVLTISSCKVRNYFKVGSTEKPFRPIIRLLSRAYHRQ